MIKIMILHIIISTSTIPWLKNVFYLFLLKILIIYMYDFRLNPFSVIYWSFSRLMKPDCLLHIEINYFYKFRHSGKYM